MEECDIDGENSADFDTSTLNDLYNLLKTHEGEVNEIAKESKMSIGGPSLMSNVNEKESVEKEDSDSEGFLVNSDDEAIAF